MLIFARYSNSDTFLILIIVFVMALVPILLVGIAGFIFWRNGKNRIVWDSAAKSLNLHLPNPKKLEMSGIYNNCQVKIAVGARRSNENTEFFTYCVTEFPQNLRFLLDINSPHYLLSKVFNATEMKLGRTVFDDKFRVGCYDANILQKLLLADFPSSQSRNLMEDLLLAQRIFDTINVTDKKVYVETSGQLSDEIRIKQMLEATTHLANRFRSARESFPLTDWEKHLFQNWQDLAAQNCLLFDQKTLQIQGVYKNFPVLIALETEKKIWQTEIKLRFQKSLMIGLKIMPENSIHKALTWLGVQDIEVGSKEFDDKFIIKGQNIQRTKHKLQPDLCRHLTELKNLSSDFLIDDNEISVTFDQLLGDEKILKSYLEAIVTTAKMFSRQS